jgi:hypothetical protein
VTNIFESLPEFRQVRTCRNLAIHIFGRARSGERVLVARGRELPAQNSKTISSLRLRAIGPHELFAVTANLKKIPVQVI